MAETTTTTTTFTSSTNAEPVEIRDLLRLTAKELKELCKAKGLKVGGNKSDLVLRLKDHANGESQQTISKRKAEGKDDISPAKPKKTKKSKSNLVGFDELELDLTDYDKIRKTLKKLATEYHHMVDDNWHDGYEEQGEHVRACFGDMKEYVACAVRVALEALKPERASQALEAIKRAHNTLFVVADSLENFRSVPARCDMEEEREEAKLTIGDGDNRKDIKVIGIPNLLDAAWKLVLAAAATLPSLKEEMNRMIKDAHDYGWSMKPLEDEKEMKTVEELDFWTKGSEALKEIYDKKEWERLSSLKHAYGRKRVADSRFETPIHRRKKGGGGGGRKGFGRRSRDECVIS